MSVGAQRPIKSANRSPCAGSSGEMNTQVAIDTTTETSDAVKHMSDNCCLSIFSPVLYVIDFLIILRTAAVYIAHARARGHMRDEYARASCLALEL